MVSGNRQSLYNIASHQFALYSTWFSDNKLALNAKKTNFMVFTRGVGVRLPDQLLFDIFNVNKVNVVKYLGFMLDDKLCWKDHILFVKSKMAKGVGMIKYCNSLFPTSCLMSLYYSFFYSYMSYGIELWGDACKLYTSHIKLLQKKCIRMICKADRLAHCAPLAKNLNLLLFDDVYKYNVLVFMFQVYRANTCSVLCNMFQKCNIVHTHNTRFVNLNFFVPSYSIGIRRNFIAVSGVILWNNLSVNVRQCNSIYKFKRELKMNLLCHYV